MLKVLDTTFLSKFKNDMENGYQSLNNPIDIVLETLISIGFGSCRYWMLCLDEIEQNSHFVLSKAKGTQDFTNKYGYTIPITECSVFEKQPEDLLSISADSVRVFEHASSHIASNSNTRNINLDLLLDDDFYIHFPILCHGDVHGQISCSYQGQNSLCNQDHINGLKIIGMMLGDYKLLYSQKKLEVAKRKFTDEEDALIQQRDNSEVLKKISSIILELVNSEFASAFDYNWYEGTLVKVADAQHGNNSHIDKFLPESCRVDEYLTGKAYKDPKYRFIYNVTKLKNNNSELIKDEVVHYLKKETHSLNGVNGCIAFGLIGKREHRSLIRIFNKAKDPRIPFDRFDLDALESACDYFSKAYDDIISFSQLDRLQRFSEQITDNFYKMTSVCSLAHQYLTDEWVSEIVVFGSLDSENYATIFKKQSSNSVTYTKLEQKITPFIKDCLDAKKIDWIELNPNPAPHKELIESYLLKNRYLGMLVVPNDFGNFKGGMGIPLRQPPNLNSREIPELHAANIKAYSSILSKLMSFMRNQLALGQARDFVGTIGHELKKPISAINKQKNLLEDAFEDLLLAKPDLAKHQYVQQILVNYQLKEQRTPIADVFNSSLSKLGELIRITDILVDTASTIAQISNNIIELTFQPINIYDLVQEISKEIRSEVDLHQGSRNLNVVFKFNDKFKDISPIVCDKYIVEKILENVFRNALKYSIPPGKNKPIEIDVVANPQPGQYLNIQVSNWGMPVPENRHEEIFLPFKRGTIRDNVRAKRGMGIGLYIARMFAEAHRGTVSLMNSVGGFDDYRRRDKEGWQTTFEIRLADNLKSGTCQFDLEKHKLLKP